MPKSRPPYPPEFRQRIIELVRKGRTPESLAEQFEPTLSWPCWAAFQPSGRPLSDICWLHLEQVGDNVVKGEAI